MNPDFEISWNADGNVTFRMGNVALGVGPGTALGYAQDLAKAIQAASRAREVKVMDPSTACMSTVSGAEYIEMRERCYAAEIALAAVERERDEARAAVESEHRIAVSAYAQRSEAFTRERSALAALRRLLDAVLAGPRTYLGEDEKRAIDAAEARLAGAPPPVAHASCALCGDKGTVGDSWCSCKPQCNATAKGGVYGCAWRDGHDGPHSFAFLSAPDVVAPPSERPVDALTEAARSYESRNGSIAKPTGVLTDLESLRADRALLRAWGEAWSQCEPIGVEIGKAAIGSARASALWRSIQEPSRAKDAAFRALHDRALALSAQGRGKGEGR